MVGVALASRHDYRCPKQNPDALSGMAPALHLPSLARRIPVDKARRIAFYNTWPPAPGTAALHLDLDYTLSGESTHTYDRLARHCLHGHHVPQFLFCSGVATVVLGIRSGARCHEPVANIEALTARLLWPCLTTQLRQPNIHAVVHHRRSSLEAQSTESAHRPSKTINAAKRGRYR
jgi:hypothetical protein